MRVDPRVLHRAGNLLLVLLAGVTVTLFVCGSSYFWLGLGLTGLTLLAGALVDLEPGPRARVVMAAGGLACALLGLGPWLDLLGSHLG